MNSGYQEKKDKSAYPSPTPKDNDTTGKDRDKFPIDIPEEILAQLGISEKDLPKFKQIISSQYYEGSFPPPWIIKGYEEALPGTSDRIFKLTENNAAHRIEHSRKKLEIENRNSLLGLVFGFTIAIAFLVGSIYLIATGNQISGTIIGTLDLVSLVSVFVIGSKLRKDERKEGLRELIKDNK